MKHTCDMEVQACTNEGHRVYYVIDLSQGV